MTQQILNSSIPGKIYINKILIPPSTPIAPYRADKAKWSVFLRIIFMFIIMMSNKLLSASINNANNWIRNEAQNAGRMAICTDPNGDVLVTGTRYTVKYDPSGKTIWAKTNGMSNAIASDPKGNIVMIDYSYRVVKFDQKGNLLWSKDGSSFRPKDNNPEGSQNYTSVGVACDPQGNVLVLGTIFYEDKHMYHILKYDPNGILLWTQDDSVPGSTDGQAAGISCDSIGDVLVTGNAAYATIHGTQNMYRTDKFDPNGNFLWTQNDNSGATRPASARAIACDSNNNVIVTGRMSIGTNGMYPLPGVAVFHTIKYDERGNVLWVQNELPSGSSSSQGRGPGGAGGGQNGMGVTCDPGGNVFILGQAFIGDAFVYYTVKYDPNGNILWTKADDSSACCPNLSVSTS